MTDIVKIQEEINLQLNNKETFNALMKTTFKGLAPTNVKTAVMEGMMRGFQFKDFLEKNVYAIPFSGGYSLVTSIDYARKIGMRSGIIGTSAPLYTEKNDKIESCSITVKRKVSGEVGEYTATVFFDEYNTKKNLWNTKPRTMIAKVAEMHALRMACPEELSQSFAEEEVQMEKEVPEIDLKLYEDKLMKAESLEELKTTWASMPIEAKNQLGELKESLKDNFSEIIEIHEDTIIPE